MPADRPSGLYRIDQYWYTKNAPALLLRPVSWLYRLVVLLRRLAYRAGLFAVWRPEVPVVVVGNVTVGGTGKTPLVIWLTGLLKRHGFSPGVVARGYRGAARHWPQQVRPDSDPVMVGDEAVVLARRCACPVAVGPDRVAAAQALLRYSDCNVIVADDGLQHYALGRDIEIAVIDGTHRFGNGYCLPAGPLRESPARLREVDFLVVNGGSAMRREYAMQLTAGELVNLLDESRISAPGDFHERRVHAVAGIGFPDRFFAHLARLGFSPIEHAFPDHHHYLPEDLRFDDGLPVVMTEKDAVKCRRFCGPNCWYLAVEAQLDPRLAERLLPMLGSGARPA